MVTIDGIQVGNSYLSPVLLCVFQVRLVLSRLNHKTQSITQPDVIMPLRFECQLLLLKVPVLNNLNHVFPPTCNVSTQMYTLWKVPTSPDPVPILPGDLHPVADKLHNTMPAHQQEYLCSWENHEQFRSTF